MFEETVILEGTAGGKLKINKPVIFDIINMEEGLPTYKVNIVARRWKLDDNGNPIKNKYGEIEQETFTDYFTYLKVTYTKTNKRG